MPILITGLSGSGKSTLAKKLQEKFKFENSCEIIHCDSYRHSDGWVERPFCDFRNDIMIAVGDSIGEFIIEGIPNESTDPEDERFEFTKELSTCVKKVIIIKEVGLQKQLEVLISRSIDRAKDPENSGADFVETPESVAVLLLNTMKLYDDNVKKMEYLHDYCAENDIDVLYESLSKIYEKYEISF